MSTSEHDKITSFLLKHDYIVKCVITNNNEVICQYNDVFQINYETKYVDKNIYKLYITYCCNQATGETTQESLLLPTYVLRWFIFLDILRLCRKHKLSHNIIRFFDEEGNMKDLPELLNITMSDTDIEVESGMANHIKLILTNTNQINKFDEHYINKGIFYDFIILKGLLV